ncbi:MAG: hypothetical protein FWE67_13895, partial [Planctomycetaceae bacterium]|nr:hypothetical protein [Planctomycetaceae bacterium]
MAKSARKSLLNRTLRVETLEPREMLSVSIAEFNTIKSQYADLNLGNYADYNIIEITATQISAANLQAAIEIAAQTTQNDLIVVRTDNNNNTVTLDGNPIHIEIDSARFGSVAVVSLSSSGKFLTVDTQNISRAFRINSGDVAMGGMEIIGTTWSFDVGSDYDGLIAVRGLSVLTTSNVLTTATVQAQAAFTPTELPLDLGNDARTWDNPDAGIWESGDAMIAGVPYGAVARDNAEFMIGSVWVPVVLYDTVSTAIADWTTTEINNVKGKIREGLDWWESMFDKFAYNPNTPNLLLTFTTDFTYADTPFRTTLNPAADWDPVTKRDYASRWIGEFLVSQGYNGSYTNYQSELSNMRQFNHDQRVANNTDWAFTINVTQTPTAADLRYGYAYLGGPYTILSYNTAGWGINDLGMVLAHEMGHLFYALDEYIGASSYTATSGYYNIQNTNHITRPGDAPPRNNVSLMGDGNDMRRAWNAVSASAPTLQMIGWRDTDDNGIQDVLDVPLTLTNTSGSYSQVTNTFTFGGVSSVQTLQNQNVYGTKNNITLNTVDKLQYRVDSGSWITIDTTYGGTTNVSVNAAVSPAGVSPGNHTIYFRTICERTGATSAESSHNFNVEEFSDLAAFNGGTITPNPVHKGDSISITTGTIENVGNVASGTYTITYYASTSQPTSANIASGINLGSFVSQPSIAVGSSDTRTHTLDTTNLAIGTSYYIGWVISDVSGEAVTTNNWAYCTTMLNINGVPDLAASNGGTITPNPVSKGNPISITTGTIENVGNAASGTYTITFYASTSQPTSANIASGINLGSFGNQPNIAAGSSDTRTHTLNTANLADGVSYYIGWVISGVDGETVLTNNWAYCTATLDINGIPNLEASNGGTITPNPVVKGDAFSVTTGEIKNIGTADSGDYKITYYALTSQPTSVNITLGINLGTFDMSNLAVGASTTDTRELSTANLASGTSYYVGWKITNVAEEDITANNTAWCLTTLKVDAPFNEHDLAKVNAAKANNGIKDGHLTWTLIGSERRLTLVSANGAGLTGNLDFAGCAALTGLNCVNNRLTSLSVSGCTALQSLSCEGNRLTSLNTLGCPVLFYFTCENNQLDSLNVSGNTALDALSCGGNKLETLDVTKSTNLRYLDCSSNQLTSLDLSKNTKMWYLYCNDNQLQFSTLNLPANASISNYDYSGQGLMAIPSVSGVVLDLSSENIAGKTGYVLKYDNGAEISSTLYKNNGGKITFANSLVGRTVYCEMTNTNYPGMTLTTTKTTLIAKLTRPVLEVDIEATTNKSVTLKWNAVPNAKSYMIEYKLSSD